MEAGIAVGHATLAYIDVACQILSLLQPDTGMVKPT